MADPVLTGIEYVSPKTNKFKLKEENVFYILGNNLDGVTLETLTGVLDNGKVIDWSDIETLDNSNPGKLKVQGTPTKQESEIAAQAVSTDAQDGDDDDDDVVGSDPGSVTPTVSPSITKQLPANYGP